MTFKELPTSGEISRAYGYDPEKYCPACYRKFKRHATRKRMGDHKHYPIFAVCNSNRKNPGNVWEVATKAHYGGVFLVHLLLSIHWYTSLHANP
jgi:hypothetical protein